MFSYEYIERMGEHRQPKHSRYRESVTLQIVFFLYLISECSQFKSSATGMNLTLQGEGILSWSFAEKRPTYRHGRPQWSDKRIGKSERRG